jgi:hypothetical protein
VQFYFVYCNFQLKFDSSSFLSAVNLFLEVCGNIRLCTISIFAFYIFKLLCMSHKKILWHVHRIFFCMSLLLEQVVFHNRNCFSFCLLNYTNLVRNINNALYMIYYWNFNVEFLSQSIYKPIGFN